MKIKSLVVILSICIGTTVFAQSILPQPAIKVGNSVLTIDETKRRADLEDPAAEYQLSNMYATGEGVPKDRHLAENMMQKAAEHGYAAAEHSVGLGYYFVPLYSPLGTQPSYKQAFDWFLKAALQGYAPSQHILGTMFEKGQGVEKNLIEAVKWYRLAADQGNPSAQSSLRRILNEH
jgi:TPR repeat protein